MGIIALSRSSIVGAYAGSGTPGPIAGTVTDAVSCALTERVFAEGLFCINQTKDS